MNIYFITRNKYKPNEAKLYLNNYDVNLIIANHTIIEILDYDLTRIVYDKCLKGYDYLGLPCVVEHGGLHINALNGLPGGLSKVVWDTLGGQICHLIAPEDTRSATAKVVVGFCDGKQIRLFEGITEGSIPLVAKGEYAFQWDPIFIPKGTEKTFAELGLEGKPNYSPAAKAWKKFALYLKEKKYV